MIWLSLLLVPYCTLAFGIHGGELVQNINRQVRNLICALPFLIVSCYLGLQSLSLVFFALAYIGANLGFDWFASSGWKYYGGLALKGCVTCPVGGFIALPLAYYIGDRTKYSNVASEYLSGTFYGLILLGVVLWQSRRLIAH